MTRRGFLPFWLEDGLELGLGMEGGGAGDGESDFLFGVKNVVIWRCWFTNGERPLLRRRDGAMGVNGGEEK